MSGLVKSPLQTVVVEGLYNDILTKNANYYYFLGKTNKWTIADGTATVDADGVWVTVNGVTTLTAPAPQDTFRYELNTRNDTLVYKLIKSSDVAFVIPRYKWVSGSVWDMYDDNYSAQSPAYSGATALTSAKYYVVTSSNNVYKCISNNYDAVSTVEPTGTSVDEFTTADGYVWKFMYNIPVALQNKFYTAQYIPVLTSIRNRFYENGAIGSVAVQDPGTGYTNDVTLAVSGDGYLENNPYVVGQNSVVTNGGGGYKSSVAITGATWLADVISVSATAHGFVNGDLISIRGVTPTGYNGDYTVANATADAFDVANAVNPGTYTSGGTIYKRILTFSAPKWGNNQIQITGTATVNGSGVITAQTNDAKVGPGGPTVYGYGYDQTATVTVAPPFVHDFTWLANASYTAGDIVKANDNFYEVTSTGSANATMPTHGSGSVTHGIPFLYKGTQAYVSLVLTKTEAIMTPIVQGGMITGVTVVDGGVGYTYCNVIPQDTPPNSTAILTADISIGDVNTLQADVELAAVDGSLSYIKMEYDPLTGYKTGAGYGVDTVVTITGDGTGATAEPVIVNGSIVAINLTNKGSGYKNEAVVTITPDHGARARAILSPSGGHGFNAIREFNSNTIMFYSVLADERIHGIPNLNDYRQFGVIKNPKRYNSTARVSQTSATSCWMITSTGSINISNFVKDDILNQGGTEVYRVVEIAGDKMIIQSYSQTAPSVANFINTTVPRNGQVLACKSLTAPQVDKFTGDILFIDNKLPFVVTADQMIVFRTTVGF